MLASLNTEFFKYVMIAASFPLWWPFLKAIYEDFNDALRKEGGLLGYAPQSAKLEELNRERGHYNSSLVNEPHPHLAGAVNPEVFGQGARVVPGQTTVESKAGAGGPGKAAFRTTAGGSQNQAASGGGFGSSKAKPVQRGASGKGGVAGTPLRSTGGKKRRGF